MQEVHKGQQSQRNKKLYLQNSRCEFYNKMIIFVRIVTISSSHSSINTINDERKKKTTCNIKQKITITTIKAKSELQKAQIRVLFLTCSWFMVK